MFATIDDNLTEPIPLQHYNRGFIVKNNTPGTYHLQIAAAKVITDAMMTTRKKNNDRMQQHDPIAATILSVNGIKTSALPINKEATVTKIPGLESEWYVLIENNDLHLMSQECINDILDNLDYDKYLSLLHNSFEENWFNTTPEYEQEVAKAKLESKKKNSVSLTDMIADETGATNKTDISDEEPAEPQVVHLFDTAGEPTAVPETITNTEPEANVPPDVATDTNIVTESDAPIGFANVSMPELIQLKQTLISNVDIANAEHTLCMNGIREIDAHAVLAKVLKTLTDTNIN